MGAAIGLGLVAGLRLGRRRADWPLAGKVVLITGGSRGLGLVLARALGREGAHLAICGRDEIHLERARGELARAGARVLAIPCDVADRDAVRHLISRCLGHFGRIDLLINNAGTIAVAPMEEMTSEDYETAMKTHFWGMLHTTLEVVPIMRRQGGGRIVNIGSLAGKLSVPHLLPYVASKSAATGLSGGLRAELAKDGILVTTVSPGLMRTGSARRARFKGRHRAEYAWFSLGASLPLLSIGAERAARRIIAACRRGDAELIMPMSAKLAARAYALLPELTADLLDLINRALPGRGGIGTKSASGADSASFLSPSWLTVLDSRAARRNNETR